MHLAHLSAVTFAAFMVVAITAAIAQAMRIRSAERRQRELLSVVRQFGAAVVTLGQDVNSEKHVAVVRGAIESLSSAVTHLADQLPHLDESRQERGGR
jgi:hypothetical protein